MAGIVNQIANKLKKNELVKNLDKLTLDKYEEDTFYDLLMGFLRIAYQHKNDTNIRNIVEYFEEYNLTELSLIFYIILSDLDIGQYVIKIFSEKTLIVLLQELINYNADPLILQILTSLEEIFPDASNAEYKILYSYAVQDSQVANNIMIEYLNKKLEQTSKGKSKPSWILPLSQSQSPRSPSRSPSQEKVIEFMNVVPPEQALEIVKRKITEKIDEEEFALLFLPEYRISTLGEKMKILGPEYHRMVTKKEITQDLEYFKLYGPLNAYNGYPHEEREADDICSKYGGCRMLLCNDFDNYDDNEIDLYNRDLDELATLALIDQSNSLDSDEIEKKDWFIGICMECHEKIEKKHYALRMPQLDGGWKGCYCSFECLEEGTEDIDTFSARMKDQLEQHGIYER